MKENKAINVTKWTIIANFSQYFISFGLSVFLARILTPKEYGLTATITLFILISKTFIDAGLSIPIVQRKDINENDLSTVFWYNLFTSLFVYTIIYYSAPLLNVIFNEPVLIPLTRLIGLNLILNSTGIIQNALLIKNLNIKKQAILNIFSLSLSMITAISMAINDYGAFSIVGQLLTNSIVLNVLLWTTSKWRPLFIFDKKSFFKLWKLGSKVLITNLLTNFIGNIDDFIVGKVYGINNLGLYSRGKSFVNMLNSIFIGSINSVSFALLSKNNDNTAEFVQNHKKIFSHSFFLLIILTILISSHSEAIIISIYSEKWRESAEILKVMIFLLFPIYTNALSSQTLLALGDGSLYFKLFMVKKTFLIFMLPFAYFLPLEQFIISFAIINISNCFIDFYILSTRLKINFHFYLIELKYIFPIAIFCFGSYNLYCYIFNQNYLILMFTSLLTSMLLTILYFEFIKPNNYTQLKHLLISRIETFYYKN